ncbi:restriction endonuclease subunit S [Maribacter aquivivus]|uniref:restriction endonuclease subunit S n=1 Tax=Maribacter aquivivus TaxID=228958 RepID=UPI002494076B|nr:restriction endonuclease subunit S [Maribacter aquivivus]
MKEALEKISQTYKARFRGETIELHEVCDSITDCHHSTPLYLEEGKLVIRNYNIKNGRMVLTNVSYTDDLHFDQRTSRAKPESGDLIITREAPMGEVCIIPDHIECCLGQRMVLIKPDARKVNNKFLLYALMSEYTQIQIGKSKGTGSIVSNLRIPSLKELKIPSLELPEQTRIGEMLGSIDAKIEVNNKINQELEAMAKSLYDYWFVQFDFPDANGKPYKTSGGKMVFNEVLKREIPEGWESGKLGDVGKVSMCKRVMKHETSLDEEIPFFKISTFGGEANIFISKDLFELYREKYSYPKRGDILISAAGTIGKTVIFDGELSYFQDSNIVWIDNDESKIPNCFLFYYYQTEPWVATGGSTIKRLYNENIRSLKTVFPNLDILNRFSKIVNPRLEKKHQIEKENKKLSELRDWLLPMLMNGQVTVGEAEQELGMVAEENTKYEGL